MVSASFRNAFLTVAGTTLLWLNSLSATRGDDVDFTRQIRPILSNRCFACHGPDKEKLQGGLRLDQESDARKQLPSGSTAIVPGKPEQSELMLRITSGDSELRMPPAHFGKPVTEGEVEILRRWIAEGAPYAAHWSYTKPVRPEVPEAAAPFASWPKNEIDQFVLQKMLQQQLQPSPEADRTTLARRVFLDLTGLPPTIEEVDQFVNSPDSNAYEQLVDNLLHRSTFGEHWARQWLDLARYADSAGYADDPSRTIWAWRDWVIRAINSGMSFDQFTREQLAGDLLPKPTDEQLIATAFHRNTMTNSEGGTNDEEFRNVAVVDRVNTTLAVWMGTTIACAQCHSHKYDPISQEDYFRVFAILNNTQDADRNDESPRLDVFTPEQKQQKNMLQERIGALQQEIDTPTAATNASQLMWEESIRSSPPWTPGQPSNVTLNSGGRAVITPNGVVRIPTPADQDVYTLDIPQDASREIIAGIRLDVLPDESLPGHGSGHADGNFIISQITAQLIPSPANPPAARYVRISIPGKEKILSLAEVQVTSSGSNIAPSGTATQSSTGFSGPPELAIDGNTDGVFENKSVTHTEISDDPWWELDLGTDRTIEQLILWNRSDANVGMRLSDYQITLLDSQRRTVEQRSMHDAPNPSTTLTLDGARSISFRHASADFSQDGYPASAVIDGRKDGKQGWAIGGATTDKHALILIPSEPVAVTQPSLLRVRIEQKAANQRHVLGSFAISTTQHSSTVARSKLPSFLQAVIDTPVGDRSSEQTRNLVQYYRSNIAPELAAQRQQLADAQQQLQAMKPATTVPVLKELTENRRETQIQYRGNYLDRGPVVTEGTPAAFHSMPADRPVNRLEFANWLVSPENPLTARVLVNRYWEALFGRGIVLTSEEFGSQGEQPTHPELLDWLATETIRSHWNTRDLLRLIVTSATYRQSSIVTQEHRTRDIDNRWLSRGPRVRLSAEAVRDQALAVSGLLSPKMYGPPVNPVQPNLGLRAAFGSSTDWQTSEGEDRHRRAIYTTWRRSSPYPSMATFDAPNREVCTIRRSQTNTPLQSLVTLNDPVYVEAAQALGRRMLSTPQPLREQISAGFQLCLQRQPSERELSPLIALYEESLSQLKQQPDDALKLATIPLGALPDGLPPAEAAAMTTVANVLLNLDEMFLKR